MSYPPSQMVNRWQGRSEPRPGQGQLYWHILLKDEPRFQTLASIAQEKLAGFADLHLTPKQWLHLTVMPAGFAEDFTTADIKEMTQRVRRLLSGMPPIIITFSRIFYHPEAIVLGVQPAGALDALFGAIRCATSVVKGQDEVSSDEPWTPHVTLAYSTAVQPVAPIIAALGQKLFSCDVTIRCVNLIVQEGPERLWKWRSLAEVPLGDPSE